jgi:hypothetical protein
MRWLPSSRNAQPSPAGVAARPGMARPQVGAKWSGACPIVGGSPPEEAAWVREHLDEVQQLRSEGGVPLLDPADSKTKERYGL